MQNQVLDPSTGISRPIGNAHLRALFYSCVLLGLFSGSLLAHGGQFSGPQPGRPSNSPKPGSPRGGGGSTAGFDPSWRNWWDRNREEFFDVRARRAAKSKAGNDQGKYAKDSLHVPATRKDINETIVPLLLSALKDKNPDVRDAAAIAVGRAASVPALEHLIPLLGDSHKKVREAALLGMGLLKHAKAEQTIINHMKARNTSFRERGVAAIALGLSGGDRAEEALSRKLGSVFPFVSIPRAKLKGVEGARALGLGLSKREGHDSSLVNAYDKAKTKDRSFKPMVLSALTKLGGTNAAGLVSRALKDRDNDVRRSAAILAGRAFSSGDEKQVKRVLSAYRSEKDAHTRQFLLISLGRLAHPLGVSALRKVMKTAKKREERAFAALALGIANDRESIRTMHKILAKEKDQVLRGAVCVSIGILGDKASGETLNKLLKATGNPVLRADLVTGLAMLDHQDSLPQIRKVTGQARNSRLVRSCGLALALLQDSTSLDQMINIMRNSGSVAVKGGMATALGRAADRRVIARLVKIVKDRRETDLTRAFAVVSLGLIGDKSERSDFSRVSIDSNFGLLNAEAYKQVLDIF
ncbi:MAG: HEAT repeat domain-containing protein [Planctomycetota bacterium]